MKPYTILKGKNEILIPTLSENYYDSCITDPPYGIRFMGKAWDKFDIENRAGNRKMARSWDVNSGRNGAHRSIAIEAGKYNLNSMFQFEQFTFEWASNIYRVLKPGAYLIVFASPRTYHRMVCGVEEAGFEIRDQIFWVFASGFPKSHNLTGEYGGYGTALKPAHEPILVARKPLDGTVRQNMEKWKTGAINIKDSLIEGEAWAFGTQTDLRSGGYGTKRPSEGHVLAKNVEGGHNGRWPANLIHDGSDEVIQLFPESNGQQGDLSGHSKGRKSPNGIYGSFSAARDFNARNDSGSAARFFYCAKTSRQDRNEGCESLLAKPLLWSSGTKSPGTFQSDNTDRSSPNNHPTVKPTALMRYLYKMFTPFNGHVIDPFYGSGSTGNAAILENGTVTGIEMDPYNCKIAELRNEWALRNRDGQLKLL